MKEKPVKTESFQTLATLLIVRQIIQNVFEAAVPYVVEKLKWSRLAYKMTQSMSHESLKKHVSTIRHRHDSEKQLNLEGLKEMEKEKSSECLVGFRF